MSCVGCRVEYIGCFDNKYGSKGIIIEDYSIKFAVVKFDSGEILKARKTNLIKINESEENNMGRLEGYYAVAVTEEGIGYNKRDYYYSIFDDGNTYKVGDKVLVSGSNRNVLEIKDIITLEEAKEKGRKDITAEIICKVDVSAYEKRVEERKEKERRKKEADKIKKQMDKMITEMDQSKRYEMYASENPELAEKLKAYKELIGE
nr:hypothetical protein [uncultured Lachnoclostridium sp.]